MSKTLNIGLIGSGFMGQAHADAYRRAGILYRNLPCTPVLYAVADQNDTLAEQSRGRLGFEKAYGDWRKMIEDPDVDVIDITTPNNLHVEPALVALEAGKHVYCEKPMAVTVEDAHGWPPPPEVGSPHHGRLQQSEDPGGLGRQTDHRPRRNRRADSFPRPFDRAFNDPSRLVVALLQRARWKRRAGRSGSPYCFGRPVLDG